MQTFDQTRTREFLMGVSNSIASISLLKGLLAAVLAVFAVIILYWVLLVPLAYGYFGWKEFVLKSRRKEMTRPMKICGFAFFAVTFLVLVFPLVGTATYLVLDLGNKHRVWVDIEAVLLLSALTLLWWGLLEWTVHHKWRSRRSLLR
jgi:hypothetical protein